MLHSECTSTLSMITDELIPHLVEIGRGVEKEGLRLNPCSGIAQDEHPKSLGSTLTHPSITTDYSEALLEFITPKQTNIDDTVNCLTGLHQYTLKNIGQQLIWPTSMPCRLDGEKSIPIALYGDSNVGQLKHAYRQGLGVRYGRVMQAIAGIHYNFSLPDSFWKAYQSKFVQQQADQEQGSLQEFKSTHYFSLIRNFRRYSWILHYLFGASPALDASFLENHTSHNLDQLLDGTYGLPYATSLRMSDLGYQNSAQEELHVSYNSLNDYVTTLGDAMKQSYKPYEEIGVKRGDQYIQLNTNVLQIENEYYSDIRPKRVTFSGEKPIAALKERGVEYIEVRILDINPFLPEGISAQQMRFMDAFLLHCLFAQCPQNSDTRCQEIRGNQRNVILRGRDPELTLKRGTEDVPFKVAATELLDAIMGTAKLLDKAHDSFDYTSSVYAQQAKVDDAALTPSGQVASTIASGIEFIDFGMTQAQIHRKHFSSIGLDSDVEARLTEEAAQSISDQIEIEKADTLSFEEYLNSYNES
ncbi:glutamate--cysteine ligase [Arenicella sp. 4NH20-0111]|uniref:glutamate--cysteine ligase n=1 Tax=Arenicella sp. 4NH20-0111 TaxID=3127648 RepID=UPI00310BB732